MGDAPVAEVAELRDVAFTYPAARPHRARPFAMDGLSFAVAPGEILGVVGPNSAGKTTLIRLLTGVLTPSAGQVRLAGRPVSGRDPAEIARLVAVVPQEALRALPFTVGELVLMGRYPHGPTRFFESEEDRARARDAMAATGILPLAHLPVETLGSGERQRAVLARALAQEPRLLLLDEPTAHLDLRYQVECVALLRRLNRQRGVSILLVSHDLNLAAELCDRLLLLVDGRIVRLGEPAEVLDESLLAGVYGCPLLVEKHPASGRVHVQIIWPEGGEVTATN